MIGSQRSNIRLGGIISLAAKSIGRDVAHPLRASIERILLIERHKAAAEAIVAAEITAFANCRGIDASDRLRLLALHFLHDHRSGHDAALNDNAVHLVEGDFIGASVMELRGTRGDVIDHRLPHCRTLLRCI